MVSDGADEKPSHESRATYRRSDMKLTEQCNAELAKTKNIVEMAVDFSAMMRVFSKDSKEKIKSKLEEDFSSLATTNTREQYEAWHQTFCEWFTHEIGTAEKKLKNGKSLNSEFASYGHAAKVLDIAVKVYVYYCAQPNAKDAERLVHFLHGAVDTALLKHLKSAYTTVKEVNEKAYRELQLLVRAESQCLPVRTADLIDSE
jgi:hypothetical protein